MQSGQRREHARYVTSLKIYWPRLTAVASRILKSLLSTIGPFQKIFILYPPPGKLLEILRGMGRFLEAQIVKRRNEAQLGFLEEGGSNHICQKKGMDIYLHVGLS